MASKYPLVLNGTSIEELQSDDTLVGVDIVNDTTPQLGGDLDLNSSDITGTGNINITGTATTSSNITVGGNATITGNLTVNGTTTTVATSNTVVSDSLIELGNGTTGSPANDSGIVIERGDSNNAFIGFDESVDKFTVGTGTFTGASTGNLSITTGTMVANIEGNVTGDLTGDVTGDVTGNADSATTLTGLTSTVSELNILDGVTATAAEINLLDGVTATTTELNLLDGVTATTTELNLLDGVTATTTELNYVDGVTSAIQTQLDAKGTLSNVVEDTSPQLGGNLDLNGFNINFGDNESAYFGNAGDLQIYHDGSNSIIHDGGTGNLLLRGNNLSLRNASNETYLTGISDGAVELYYDNSKRLETTSAGVTITTTGLDNGLIVQSTYADDNTAPDLILYRNSSSPADDDNLGQIEFRGKNDAASDKSYARISTQVSDVTSGTEDAHIRFYVMEAGTLGEKFRMNKNGDFHADGNVIGYSTTISDERLKTGIITISDALTKVKALRGVEFTYKADGKRSAGLIAQDVEKVLPSAVTEKELPLKQDDRIEYKTLQYDQTIGLLVEAIKELSERLEEVENK